eukprot:TRINITY_DN1258_c0_g1_i2.p1 TRINITY_DN1258_c0_g1~~TRINITY_DN1258_c0_g1_i2.p1  ORF type:complete len:383 (+),score=77.56 TRINITY_DN1258_c0_g1_i2:263-1411(+)
MISSFSPAGAISWCNVGQSAMRKSTARVLHGDKGPLRRVPLSPVASSKPRGRRQRPGQQEASRGASLREKERDSASSPAAREPFQPLQTGPGDEIPQLRSGADGKAGNEAMAGRAELGASRQQSTLPKRKCLEAALPLRARGGKGSQQLSEENAEKKAQGADGKQGRGGAPQIATRQQVATACATTSLAMAVAALVLRQGSHWAAEAGWPVQDCTVSIPYGVSFPNVAVGVGVAAGVTLARFVLLQSWPAFAAASDASNQQVLPRLAWADLLWVGALPGLGEELLFRGALLPLVAPDWRGAAVAGAVFGALHVGGKRNAAFALWATGVGFVYGVAEVLSLSLALPVVAHATANVTAAALWKYQHPFVEGSIESNAPRREDPR